MKVFLRISVALVILASIMIVLTVFEFKDGHMTYRKPQFNNQPIDNDSNVEASGNSNPDNTNK